MNTLHLTTAPRLAMKTVDGVLVNSINTKTGKQDVQRAGRLLSFLPTPVEYVKEDGTSGTLYRGKSEMVINGETVVRDVAINGSAIEAIAIGEVYWVTCRPSKDGQYTNYNQGALTVMTAPSVDEFEELYASLVAESADVAIAQ
jgi:hypothetical protein